MILGGVYPGLYALWAPAPTVIADAWLTDFIVIPRTGRVALVPRMFRELRVLGTGAP